MPNTQTSTNKTPYLVCGKIIKPQGLHGEVKVQPLTDDPQRFLSLKQAFLQQSDGYRAVAVVSVRLHEAFVYLQLQGITSRDQAEQLRGQYLWVDRANAAPLPQGRYYIVDIIGAQLLDENGQSHGHVKEIIQTGATDVYVIEQGKKQWMMPALKSIILRYVLDENYILIDPTQLLEVDEGAY